MAAPSDTATKTKTTALGGAAALLGVGPAEGADGDFVLHTGDAGQARR